MQGLLDIFLGDEILKAVEWDKGDPKVNVIQSKKLGESSTLVISLNRFTSGLQKINDPINNVSEVIIRASQTADSTSDKKYVLTGFIHHGGTFGNGHYIAYIKEGTEWICYNDSAVSKISDETAEAKAEQAYVLFYKPK